MDSDENIQQMVKFFILAQMDHEYKVMPGNPEDKPADIYKIIGGSVAEGLDFFAKK